MTNREMYTGTSVKRATKELEVKQSTETTAKPATCTEQNTSPYYYILYRTTKPLMDIYKQR
jgi:hypothetical protein